MSAIDCAAFLVGYACDNKQNISNLQLQKMLFFAQVDYMRAHNCAKLFDDDIHAWQYGPVVPYVYNAYSRYGGSPILSIESPSQDDLVSITSFLKSHDASDSDRKQSLTRVFAKWVNKPAWSLVAESHEEGKAWDLVYNRNGVPASGYGDVIPDYVIRDSYGCR